MADWRERGYVPDSDEEDDNQSPHLTDLPISHSQGQFHDIDDLQEQREEIAENGDVPRGKSGLVSEAVQHGTSKRPVESGIATKEGIGGQRNTARAQDRNEVKPHEVDGAIIERKIVGEDDDVDELGQDHYDLPPAAPSGGTALEIGPLHKDCGNGGPFSPPGLNESSRSSPVLSSNPLSALATVQPESQGLPTTSAAVTSQGANSNSICANSENTVRRNVSVIIRKQAIGEPAAAPRVGRSFRQRNPIQLHPYAIESEKYRQSLKARGIKPLHIVHTQNDRASAAEDVSQTADTNIQEESQSTAEGFSSSSQNSSPLPIGPSRLVSSSPTFNKDVRDEGDEFPDLASLLRSRPPQFAPFGNKRRKTGGTYSRKYHPLSTTPTSLPPRNVEAAAIINEDVSIYDMPASPPLSGSSRRSDLDAAAPKFKFPRGLTPVGLPTPLTSSEPRRRPQTQLLGSEESDDPTGIAEDGEHSGAASSPENKLSEDESGKEMEQVQRKIRGVLPASWLKLDQKLQVAKTQKVHRAYQDRFPEAPDDQRGIARVIPRPRVTSPSVDSNFPIILSDDESSGKESEGSETWPELDLRFHATRGVTQDPHGDPFGYGDDRYGEVAEDNRVDAMLPSSRQRNVSSKKRSQKRVKQHQNSPKASIVHPVPHESRRNHQYQPKITEQLDKKRRKRIKFRPPNLSILDAVHSPAPHFVKLASRTARLRADKGRQSPTHKILKLATYEDTDDINTTLRNWREGTLQPRRMVDQLLPRKPLEPRSANGEVTRRLPYDTTKLARTIVKSKSRSSTIAPRRPQKSQGTLDNIIQRGPARRIEPQVRKYKYTHSHSELMEPSTRGQIYSALRSGKEVRPALLETSKEEHDQTRPGVAFRQGLVQINRLKKIVETSHPIQSPLLNDPVRSKLGFPGYQKQPAGGAAAGDTTASLEGSKPYHQKKRRPKRVDVDSSNYRQSSEPLIMNAFSETRSEPPATTAPKRSLLSGLDRFDRHYSSTFGVTPLPGGTRFPKDTFIGSGDFHRSTALSKSEDMDRDRGSVKIQTSVGNFNWGQWNAEVSTEIDKTFNEVVHVVSDPSDQSPVTARNRESTIALLRCTINYFSDHLSFIDPVDRVELLQRCTALVSLVVQELASVDAPAGQAPATPEASSTDLKIQLGALNLALANQLSQIAQHDLVPDDSKEKADALIVKSIRCTLSLVLQDRFAVFHRYLRDLQHLEGCEYSILANHAPLEAFVICYNTLSNCSPSLTTFWQIINDIFPITTHDKVANVQSMEKLWQSLFTLLPFLEFNSYGALEVGMRFKVKCDNWAPIKQLISHIVDAYLASSVDQRATLNSYCRTIFARCFHLISDWNWARCESIIGTLFDFFARNNLAHLRNEACHGSPQFLEHLAENPCLRIGASDRCFHILLKIIAKGLQRMRSMYPAKKIRDIVWRLMPNHGRSHPKEEAIRQEDLDALRNHHDLLCTLYWASPPDFRPRLTVLRNLVHLETSHREACHLNIRAWSYLVEFQLSTQEPLTSLQPFADWHDDLLVQILRQHAQARTEAEEQVHWTEYNGGLSISKDILETTISRNQRQVEAVLGDALVRLQLATAAARGPGAARILLTPALVPVFGLFDARQPQSNAVVMQALDVVLAYVKHAVPRSDQQRSKDSNDDSQDYGDWSAFAEDDVSYDGGSQKSAQTLAATYLRDEFEGPLRHLLSNCFGADTSPQEDLLVRVVDAWTTVASLLVNHGMKSWSDYLSPFGQDSWGSLRQTQQTRKFHAYFLACLIEVNEDIYFDHREHFLRSWIESLVERESLLKFQHRLTSALLNVDAASPLLKNLPFWAEKDARGFNISPSDFSLRRLSLISSVLSNMRESMDNAGYDRSAAVSRIKQEYKELLKQLMAAMRRNYQELGPTSNIHGAYVDFAHRVVEFLQQHTTSICPVDRFFTDSSAFPLPVEDPLYVVGQLKNYGLRLQDPRTPKQLAVFLQSVSERAATEGQQQYLVDQLYTAMSGEYEHGDANKPTLRSFVVQAIIPAYIELGFGTSFGWPLLSPFLQALRKVFDELLDVLDGTNAASVAAVTSTIDVYLQSFRGSLQLLVDDLSFLQQPQVLHLLGECFVTATALLPTLDYILRLRGPVDDSIQCIRYLKSFASFTSPAGVSCCQFDASWVHRTEIQGSFVAVQGFALQELKDSLSKHWTQYDGRYYVTRGNMRKEVLIDLGAHEEEKDGYVSATRDFFHCLETLPAFRDQDEDSRAVEERRNLGLGDLLI